jgi:hypothetical protein
VSPVRYELGFISQKTAFFIVTAVKTSNLTRKDLFTKRTSNFSKEQLHSVKHYAVTRIIS